MKVEQSLTSFAYASYTKEANAINTDDLQSKKLDAKTISKEYYLQYQAQIQESSQKDFTSQNDIFTLADIGYSGKPIAQLSQNEAKELVSEDGFFGVKQTSERIADFVLNGAGDDVAMLQAGKEGIMRGFEEAEKLWGSKLPDISYETIQKAVAMIDEKLTKLGANVLDLNV
ncbi:MAG: hydrogenase-4 component G [Sulfurospirillum sp.]|nr:hydrogenase-4 component G [Sulfurospirillum sp.]